MGLKLNEWENAKGEEEIAWFRSDIMDEYFDRSLSVSYFPRGLEIWQML
jgi:hypothetical protein